LTIVQTAKQQDAQTLYRLQSVPGIGKILSVVLLYEIHDITRFPRVQDFVSYCRLVKCAKESAGKRYGTSGTKIGNAYLKWAFSEAAGLFLRNNPAGQKYLARLEKKHGKGKALTVLAHKLARAVYYMLKRDVVFDLDLFLQSSGRGVGEPAASLGHDGRAWQPCSAMMHLLRRRTLMSTEALCPDPVRLIGRLLSLRSRRRKFLMVTVCCPSPEPEANWRTKTCSPSFE
jgi:Transposase IS116/IS110/IS902 family